MDVKVGFGRYAAMPETVMPLGGVGLVGREYTGIHSELYITCLAFTDEAENTVLVYTQDFLKSDEEYTREMRDAISRETGVPFHCIMVSSTHTHAAPPVYYDKVEGIPQYRKICIAAAVRAAKDALEDRTPAQLKAGRAKAEGLAFSRHYVMADGTVKKTPGKKACPVAHADPADDEVQLIRCCRGDKKDILLVNFNIHPTFLGRFKDKLISSDAPGAVRAYLEQETGCLAAYFTGAAGNQTGNSQVAETDHGLDLEGYGSALGNVILRALPQMQPVRTGPIRITAKTYTGSSNKERIELMEEAEAIAQIHSKQGEEAAKPFLAQYGIASVWEAYAIRRRYAAPPTMDMPLNVLSLGDVSFIFAPYEMFGANGIYIKANTPDAMTVIVTCANASKGYLPTKKAFSYDVYEKLVTNFAPGTAEEVAETFVSMLKELKEK